MSSREVEMHVLVDGSKVWGDPLGQYVRYGDEGPYMVKPDGTTRWHYHADQEAAGSLSFLSSCGDVWYHSSEDRHGVSFRLIHEVSSVEYAGIEYSAPYWMVEVYADADLRRIGEQ